MDNWFELNSSIILLIDPDNGKIIEANKTARDYYGYSHEKFQKSLFIHDINTLSAKEIKIEMQNAVKSGRNYFNFKHRIASGEVRDVEVYTSKLSKKNKTFLLSIVHDITDRKRLEEELRKSKKQYELIAENTSDSIAILSFDEKLTYLYVNKTKDFEKGFEPEFLIGKSLFDFIHPDDSKTVLKLLNKYLKIKNDNHNDIILQNIKETLQFRAKSADGTWRYMQATVNVIDNDLLAISKDITKLIDVEVSLRKSRDYAEKLLNLSAGIILSLDKKGNITILNDNGYEILGYEKGSLIGKNWFDLCIPAESKKEIQTLYKHLMNGTVEDRKYYENPIITKLEEVKIIRWFNTLLHDDNENINGLLSSGEDITKKKAAEKALKESEKNFRDLVKNMMDGVAIMDENGYHIYVNDRFSEITGYSKDELSKMTGWDFTRPKDIHRLKQLMKDRIAGKKVPMRYDRVIVKKDGSEIVVELSTTTTLWKGIIRPMVIVHDITKRKKIEEELFKSQELFKNLYDTSPDMHFSVDPDGIILSVNKYGAHYLGYSIKELIGKKVWKVVYKKDINIVKKHLITIMNTCGKEHEIEFRKIKKDGKIIFVQERIKCFCDKDGTPKELRIVCRDITQNKKALQKISDYQENLKSLTYELNSVEEKTKREVATKLHDDIGQAMALSKISLSNISENMSFTEVKENINSVVSLLTQAIQQSRDLTYELSSPILHELGLVAAINWYTIQISKIFDIKFQIHGAQDLSSLSDENNILLYKSIVELLNNTVKHSEATIVSISFKVLKSFIRIIVKDNGIGFKLKKGRLIPKDKKFGLFNVSEKIDYIGGEVIVDSKIHNGTKVTIKIPI